MSKDWGVALPQLNDRHTHHDATNARFRGCPHFRGDLLIQERDDDADREFASLLTRVWRCFMVGKLLVFAYLSAIEEWYKNRRDGDGKDRMSQVATGRKATSGGQETQVRAGKCPTAAAVPRLQV